MSSDPAAILTDAEQKGSEATDLLKTRDDEPTLGPEARQASSHKEEGKGDDNATMKADDNDGSDAAEHDAPSKAAKQGGNADAECRGEFLSKHKSSKADGYNIGPDYQAELPHLTNTPDCTLKGVGCACAHMNGCRRRRVEATALSAVAQDSCEGEPVMSFPGVQPYRFYISGSVMSSRRLEKQQQQTWIRNMREKSAPESALPSRRSMSDTKVVRELAEVSV
jgi:hypothetical protein